MHFYLDISQGHMYTRKNGEQQADIRGELRGDFFPDEVHVWLTETGLRIIFALNLINPYPEMNVFTFF